MVVGSSKTIEVQTIKLEVRLDSNTFGLYHNSLMQFDKQILEMGLNYTRWNITKTALLLGLNRVTVRTKIKSLMLVKPGKGGKN